MRPITRLFFVVLFCSLSSLAIPDSVNAQNWDWARKMFSAHEHDFGTVARNEKAEHVFEIENLYQEELRIVGVTTSCACTDLTLDKYILRSGEKANLLAKFNTRQFTGFKQATVTIRFAPPMRAEVQLTVRGTIRGDIVFEPSMIDFGSITSEGLGGKTNARQIKITKFNNPNWQIRDIKSKYPHVGVSLSPPVRHGNQVSYNMNVRLKKSAPPGAVFGELMIVGSDGVQTAHLPLKFSAKVAAPLQISPEVINISAIQGKTFSTKVVIKAARPFRISDVTCTNSGFSVAADPQKESKVHFVKVSYSPDQPPGRYEYDLEFVTDLNSRTTGKIKAVVEVRPEITEAANLEVDLN